MPSNYVFEDKRKHKYVTRAVTYYIQRITEPMDSKPREYRSIRKMSIELGISDFQIREFVKSRNESAYLRSKTDNILYLIKKPVKDIAITNTIEQVVPSGVKCLDVSYLIIQNM